MNQSKNKILKWLFVVTLTYCLMEVCSFSGYSILKRSFFSLEDSLARKDKVISNVQILRDTKLKVTGLDVPWNVPIHPYYGFGNPPGFAFLESKGDPVQTDKNGIVVAITGGSVAWNLYKKSSEIIKHRLEIIPYFKGKNIYIICIGQFAWKQPQQLTALAYYLAMGGKLDILINLDGHNEIVDSGFNYGKKVFPAYPWLWYHLASNVLSSHQMRLIGKITSLKEARYHIATLFSHVNFNITLNVLWTALDDCFLSLIGSTQRQLDDEEQRIETSLPFYRFGPRLELRSLQEFLDFSAETWKQSSIQLKRLAESNGAIYFHFLQPNQYVPDSKKLTREEIQNAYDPRRRGVTLGYPFLLNRVTESKQAGVLFYSLTSIFKEVEETIYEDKCCHVNKKGNDLMAESIATIIAKELIEE